MSKEKRKLSPDDRLNFIARELEWMNGLLEGLLQDDVLNKRVNKRSANALEHIEGLRKELNVDE